MSINKMFLALFFSVMFFLIPCSSKAQGTAKGPLFYAKSIKCTFSVMAVGTWGDKQPDVKVKPFDLVVQFDGINADEGSAELKSDYGKYDIIVRYSDGYLHFIQSFLNGPLYVTTVLEKKTTSGKLKGMHSRHEFTDYALPGFTSSPEQYYGECEILK